jgi:hypothetical protein
MREDKLRSQAIGLLAGLGLQFVAGMLLNLFVTIPGRHPGSSGSAYVSRSYHSLGWALSNGGGWELTFHVYLGLLVTIGTLALLIHALLVHNRNWIIFGGTAAVLTLGAFFNGLSFVDYNKNISSMIMAVCWLGAISALVAGLAAHSPELSKVKRT